MSKVPISRVRLEALLLKQGLSPEDLSNLVHGLPRPVRGAKPTVSGRSIRRWLDRRELDAAPRVQRSKIAAIAQALQVSVEGLVDAASPPDEPVAASDEGRPRVAVEVCADGRDDVAVAREISRAVQKWRFISVCHSPADRSVVRHAYVAKIRGASGGSGMTWDVEVVGPEGDIICSADASHSESECPASERPSPLGIIASQIALSVYLDARRCASEIQRPMQSAWTEAFAGVQEGYKFTLAALDCSRGRLRGALELNSTLAYAWYSLAYVENAVRMLVDAGTAANHAKLAQQYAETSIGLDPYDAYGQVVLAYICSRSGRRAEAISSFERAIALNENLGIAHTGLGQELTLEARYRDALPCLNRAVPLMRNDPLLWVTYSTRALASFGARDYARSVEDALWARNQAPTHPGTCGLLAAGLHYLGRRQQAIATARESNDRWPWYNGAHIQRAYEHDDPELRLRLAQGFDAALGETHAAAQPPRPDD